MLTELRIKNFAIIEGPDFSFGKGMNVITGETGAGKSIIIQAVNLILGDRAASNLVRSGEKEAIVEAMFETEEGSIAVRTLNALGIETEEGVVIRRVISQEGKNKVFINGTMATLAMLSDVVEGLISISSQHEHQGLLRPESHMELLDDFGGIETQKAQFKSAFQNYIAIRKNMEVLNASRKDRLERIDLLSFQLAEIEKAELKEDEDDVLNEERKVLSNAESLASTASRSESIIYSDEDSIIEKLDQLIGELKESSEIDESLKEVVCALEGSRFQLEDSSLILRNYSAGIEADPERLEFVEERLVEIERLKKKYGPKLSDVLRLYAKIKDELDSIEGGEGARDDLEKKVTLSFAEALSQAKSLSALRHNAAENLSGEIERELKELGMSAGFEVRFTSNAQGEDGEKDLREHGLEQAEFYITPNPGEEAKPLAKTASGGELSRIMLALKGCLLKDTKTPTFIFDEVDSGIGGGTAEIVGNKIKKVSCNSQVICITHLPQIASLGDSHYLVVKNILEGRTFTSIETLGKKERVEEVARMLGGVEITNTTREHAREMLADNA